MQLTFRIDDNNFLTFDLQLQRVAGNESDAGPELIAAVVTDSKLSNISDDDLMRLVEQVVDYTARPQGADKPSGDWFENEWLPLRS